MSDSTHDSDFPKPSKISSGEFSYGSVFSLICEIRGSKYNIGDKFILVEQEDCTDPNILKLGGVGERYFIDSTGNGLIIHANDTTIDSIFCHIPETIIVENKPDPIITESVLSEFKENIVEALSRIASLIPSTGSTGSVGRDGDKGDKGDTGLQGIQGDNGETGLQGIQGEKGDTGLQGIQGEKGDTGLQGDKGETGLQGIQGDIGLPGLQGIRGICGERGDKGDKGERGIYGTPGIKGDKGLRGDQGDRGIEGPKGDKGQTGVAGPKGDRGIQGIPGIKGNDGKSGSQGIAGKKGNTGSSGVISAKFPLVYDTEQQSIAIDEDRLDKILKKIMGGGRVSPQDMGWFASTGGGGKVAVYINGSKITPDVRTLDFVGAGVTASKVGGKIIVNFTSNGGGGISGDYVSSVNGIIGSVSIKAGAGITSAVTGNTYSHSINYRNGGATFASYKDVVSKDYLLLQRYVAGGGTSGEMYTATVSEFLTTKLLADIPAIINTLAGVSGASAGALYSYASDGTPKLLSLVGARSDILTDVTSIGSSGGAITIDASSGVTFTGNIYASNNVYVVGDLIVTGRIVTSTGLFGATANAITEPVSDMIMDGGSF